MKIYLFNVLFSCKPGKHPLVPAPHSRGFAAWSNINLDFKQGVRDMFNSFSHFFGRPKKLMDVIKIEICRFIIIERNHQLQS